tara:strand:+ start:3360 stop:4352 length:993 start_codon:yes stop_codon:yes gene_type:complete
MLRARRLFWVVLVLSGLIGMVYASIGFNERGVSALFGLLAFESELFRMGTAEAKELYLLLFTNVIIPYWLGFCAIVLGLISCASIFPEFIQKGSIDFALSKPPARVTLFFGKYLGSLLFVLMQVLPFSLIVYLSLGLRFGDWNMSVFWAVPLVVLSFSFVYAVHVLISVWSGSMILGLFAALLVWGGSVLVEWGEDVSYQFAYTAPQLGIELDWEEADHDEVEPRESSEDYMVRIHWVLDSARLALPKTRAVGGQMRSLIRVDENGGGLAGKSLLALLLRDPINDIPERHSEIERAADQRHPVWKDLGSSLLYELAVAGLALVIFVRRDF